MFLLASLFIYNTHHVDMYYSIFPVASNIAIESYIDFGLSSMIVMSSSVLKGSAGYVLAVSRITSSD